MTNEELKAIREEKNQSKGDFAKLLGITPMMVGRYESGKVQIPDAVAEKVRELSDAAAAAEIEIKKTARKTVRKAKEAAEDTAAKAKEAVADQAAAEEIAVRKTVRKAGRKAAEAVETIAAAAMDAEAERMTGLRITIQSPMGGYISTADIAKKVPAGTVDVYVRVDENKLYYVLANGETGSINIWD